MALSAEILLYILGFVVLILVLGLAFDRYWSLQWQYPHEFGFRKDFAYLKNELRHKLRGDKRSDFEKIVERCEILESTRNIYDRSGSPD